MIRKDRADQIARNHQAYMEVSLNALPTHTNKDGSSSFNLRKDSSWTGEGRSIDSISIKGATNMTFTLFLSDN